ncbi:MAG: Na(+)-translocating NADH-quinone reductase subunit A [Gammaproteobacteria bacterium]|nr:Na(+)-translocating NADH-quinone reductase subunit A [Gammaproteobacteria bacterium]
MNIRKGLDLPITGSPEQKIHDGPPAATVGLIGQDYVDLKATMFVEEGARVQLGQALFEDKRNPGVVYAAPGAGVVAKIHRGPKRVLQSVEIRLEGDGEVRFKSFPEARLAELDAAVVRENLIQSGLWTNLRTRPYSRVPRPNAEPAAIFVPAIDTRPLAPDPAVVLRELKTDFVNGLKVLTRLTQGEVFVCKAPGADIPVPDLPQIRVAEFAGPHPAGLVGTHMHFLKPASAKRVNWHIGYQDVVAIGKLFTSGRLWDERIVALAGPPVQQPRLLRVRRGSHIPELIEGQLRDVEARVISGSVWGGRRAAGWASYLGRYHNQITVLPEGHERHLFGWLNPAVDRYSVSNVFFSALARATRRFGFSTSTNGSPRAMVPIGNYEKVMPLDILATPLLRYLLVRDTDMAQQLGALELDEEDLALCSFVCVGKYDFGPHLRACLEIIEAEG